MVALVMSIQPILVMTLSYALLNSPLNVKQAFAGLIAIGSIALLVLNNQAALSTSGILMGLPGTVSWPPGW